MKHSEEDLKLIDKGEVIGKRLFHALLNECFPGEHGPQLAMVAAQVIFSSVALTAASMKHAVKADEGNELLTDIFASALSDTLALWKQGPIGMKLMAPGNEMVN